MSVPFHPAPLLPIQAVAFDLDGLMFDTEALFFQVASAMLADRGKVFTHEIMAAMIGRQAPISGQVFKTMAGLDEPVDVLMAEARERFFAVMDDAVHTTPGLIVLLDRLKTANLPLAVTTSSRRSYAERLLRNHHLLDRFAFLLTAEDVERGKPDPEIYRKAAIRFGVDPGSMLVLEDSATGLAAARSAGAFTVAIPHEHSPAEGLGHASWVLDRLDHPALLDLFGRAG
jgi:HAD superfamily hydrolase (TIGR01509 family)